MNNKQVRDTVKKWMSFLETVKDWDLREILFLAGDPISFLNLLEFKSRGCRRSPLR